MCVASFWTRVDKMLNGVSLRRLSTDTEISYDSIFSSRQRKTPPKAEHLVKIAEYLGTTVEYLVTGKHIDEDDYSDLRAKKEESVYKPSFNRTSIQVKKDSGYIELPIYPQSVSAGSGEDWLYDAEPIGMLPIPLDVIGGGIDPSKVGVMRASGDSMTGVSIHSGDYIIWSHGIIDGDGIYVIAIHGELFVKRLEFEPLTKIVKIISENPRYKDREVDADSDIMRICGKVIGWMHRHPY